MPFPEQIPAHPCPDMSPSYWGAVTCQPVGALTRALLPATAAGAAWGAFTHPGPQYMEPMYERVARGAAAGSLFGGALVATAYVHKWTDRSALATFATGLVTITGAVYGAVLLGACPTA